MDSRATGGVREPDLLVFDLIPGRTRRWWSLPGRQLIRDIWTRTASRAAPRPAVPRMQLYVPVRVTPPERTSEYASPSPSGSPPPTRPLSRSWPRRAERRLRRLEPEQPSQRTHQSPPIPYGPRTTPRSPRPVTWREVQRCRKPADLTFTAPMSWPIGQTGDLLAEMHQDPGRLPRCLTFRLRQNGFAAGPGPSVCAMTPYHRHRRGRALHRPVRLSGGRPRALI